MALPSPTSNWLQNSASTWFGNREFPNRMFELNQHDYELYEDDGKFVLTVEMPGFDREEITVSWDDGILNVAAEHEDEHRGQRKTYHRRFRFPKDIEDEDITARYRNGVLEVALPVMAGATVTGREIEIES